MTERQTTRRLALSQLTFGIFCLVVAAFVWLNLASLTTFEASALSVAVWVSAFLPGALLIVTSSMVLAGLNGRGVQLGMKGASFACLLWALKFAWDIRSEARADTFLIGLAAAALLLSVLSFAIAYRVAGLPVGQEA